jgi:hypothetical protein
MVIAYVGSEELTCLKMGLAKGVIAQWIARKNIPAKYCIQLSMLVNERIRPEEFLKAHYNRESTIDVK